MSLLDKIFGTGGLDIHPQWKILESESILEQALMDSHQKVVALFKHSTRCGVSSTVMNRLIREWPFEKPDFDFYYLDLIRYRPISNRIAEELDVHHESPQLIIVKNGKPVFDTSHFGITTESLEKALDS
jgi:bacillithiol system protein YtxJ